MNKENMKKLHKGSTVYGRMKQGINLPMQGTSFSAGEPVAVTPYRPGASAVIVTSTQDSSKRAEMSLYQVEQLIS